jgi:hypothetical protein
MGASDAGFLELSAQAQAFVTTELAERECKAEEGAMVSVLTLGESTGLLFRRAFHRMVAPRLGNSFYDTLDGKNLQTPVDEASDWNILHSITSLSFRHAESILKQRNASSLQPSTAGSRGKQTLKPRVAYKNPVAPTKRPVSSSPVPASAPKKEPAQREARTEKARNPVIVSDGANLVPSVRNLPKPAAKLDTGHIVMLELKRLRALLGGDERHRILENVFEVDDPLVQSQLEEPFREPTPAAPPAVKEAPPSLPSPKSVKLPTSPLNRLLPGGIKVTQKASSSSSSSTLEFDGPPISTPFGVGKLLRARVDGFNVVEFSWGVGLLRNDL